MVNYYLRYGQLHMINMVNYTWSIWSTTIIDMVNYTSSIWSTTILDMVNYAFSIRSTTHLPYGRLHIIDTVNYASETEFQLHIKILQAIPSWPHANLQIKTHKTWHIVLFQTQKQLSIRSSSKTLKHGCPVGCGYRIHRQQLCRGVQLPNECPDMTLNNLVMRFQNHRWIATNNRDVSTVMKTKFQATVMVFGGFTSCHITSSKSAWKSTPKYTWMCWRVWWSPGAIRCSVADCGCGSRTRHRPTSPKRPRLGFRRSATTLYPSLTASHPPPRPEPAGLLRLVIRREHHQHDLPQHQSQPDHRHPPSIRRAPTGACGKGMLPVPDPYRGSDWGWRRPHWIDISSIT